MELGNDYDCITIILINKSGRIIACDLFITFKNILTYICVHILKNNSRGDSEKSLSVYKVKKRLDLFRSHLTKWT